MTLVTEAWLAIRYRIASADAICSILSGLLPAICSPLLGRCFQYLGKAGSHHLDTARCSEMEAYFYLQSLDCRIVAKNFRTPHKHGETNIMEWHDGRAALRETATRRSASSVPLRCSQSGLGSRSGWTHDSTAQGSFCVEGGTGGRARSSCERSYLTTLCMKCRCRCLLKSQQDFRAANKKTSAATVISIRYAPPQEPPAGSASSNSTSCKVKSWL